jgi:hypothetical protein
LQCRTEFAITWNDACSAAAPVIGPKADPWVRKQPKQHKRRGAVCIRQCLRALSARTASLVALCKLRLQTSRHIADWPERQQDASFRHRAQASMCVMLAGRTLASKRQVFCSATDPGLSHCGRRACARDGGRCTNPSGSHWSSDGGRDQIQMSPRSTALSQFVRPSARPTNCYPTDRMMHQVPEWFVQRPRRAGAARLDSFFARMQHCSGPARSGRAAMPPQRHRGDRFSRERQRAVTAPPRPGQRYARGPAALLQSLAKRASLRRHRRHQSSCSRAAAKQFAAPCQSNPTGVAAKLVCGGRKISAVEESFVTKPSVRNSSSIPA